MNEKQTKFMGNMKKKAPLDFFKFIELYRRLYNILCRECQEKTFKSKGQIDLIEYCDKCRDKAKNIIFKSANIILKHGGKIEVKP